jgi:hypothetical protein
VLFVSAEPLLGGVSLRRWLGGLRWVIAGGESLAGSRPSHPDWFRGLRDACAARGVPFFFKQWGDWAPLPQVPATDLVTRRLLRDLPWHAFPPRRGEKDGQLVYRIGNDAAGARLDGSAWRQVPGQQSEARGGGARGGRRHSPGRNISFTEKNLVTPGSVRRLIEGREAPWQPGL